MQKTTLHLADSAIMRCAERLFDARAARAATAPVRSELPPGDVAAAYAVQAINIARHQAAGARAVGRKIGLTSEAVQRQLGVDQPDFGVLLDTMDFSGHAEAPLGRLIAPRIEAEFAFLLGVDLVEPGLSRDRLSAAVDGVAAAAEIVDSAIAGWDIDIVDTIADNASSAGFVVGPWQPWASYLDLQARRMALLHDGEAVSTGVGAASLGDPINALAWLADTAVAFDAPLRAGDVVLAGALGPMVDLRPGRWSVEIEGFERLGLAAA